MNLEDLKQSFIEIQNANRNLISVVWQRESEFFEPLASHYIVNYKSNKTLKSIVNGININDDDELDNPEYEHAEPREFIDLNNFILRLLKDYREIFNSFDHITIDNSGVNFSIN